MSNAKHTPGPWKVVGYGTAKSRAIRDAGDHPIASVAFAIGTDGYEDPEALDANARLIAAAPRMAKALQRAAFVLAELQDQSPQVLALRYEIVAAIKEATPEYYAIAEAEGK